MIKDCPVGTFNSPTRGNGTTTTTHVIVPSDTPAHEPLTIVYLRPTSIAVPAVLFEIGAPAPGATPSAVVGLVVGAVPPQFTAAATATRVSSVAPQSSSLSSKGMSSAVGTGAVRPSGTGKKPSDAQFTGAASLFGMKARHVVFAAVAFFAL